MIQWAGGHCCRHQQREDPWLRMKITELILTLSILISELQHLKLYVCLTIYSRIKTVAVLTTWKILCIKENTDTEWSSDNGSELRTSGWAHVRLGANMGAEILIATALPARGLRSNDILVGKCTPSMPITDAYNFFQSMRPVPLGK